MNSSKQNFIFTYFMLIVTLIDIQFYHLQSEFSTLKRWLLVSLYLTRASKDSSYPHSDQKGYQAKTSMYHRNSTKFHHLDRRKSISSVKSVHLEYVHPETAERDAHAAATQAFARAKERSATEATLWPPRRTNDSSVYECIPERRSNDSAVRRQQSIRFVREREPQNTQQYTTFESTVSSSRIAIGNSEFRPTANASAAGMVSAAKGTAGDYINALLTGEEYYTPEDDIASAPSSYRKVRKSRSMFTCSEASIASRNYVEGQTLTGSTQLSPIFIDSPILGTSKSVPSARLKAPKSMSFLRGRRDQQMLFSKRRGSAPMGLSNNGIAGTLNKGPLKSHPSAFLRSRSSNADRVFRKSMRDDSNDTLVDWKSPKEGSLRNRARKVSHNFKHKLKSLFSLVKGDNDEAVFPPQQIEASKSHITNIDDADYIKDEGFRFEPISDGAALSRVPSGVPSLHAVPSHQQLRSRQGSVESLRSERRASDERSRVTSWSNSDTNTVNTSNSHRGEWERQRLSVIKENGMHVSSSSARYRGVTSHTVNSNASVRSLPPPIPRQPAMVNSQRIYSALMKRLNDTNKHSKSSQVQKQSSVDDFINTGVVPPRGSSRDHERRRTNSVATIRHVASDGISDSSSVRITERKSGLTKGRVETQQNEPAVNSSIGMVSTRLELPSSRSAPLGRGSKGTTNTPSQSTSVPLIEPPTPPVRTLSTRSSAFFASPTCHLFRTRSPYRRALQDSMRTESENTQLRSPEYNPWMRSLTGLPIRCPSTCESEVDKKMQYAKSVYSSTTEEPATISSSNTPAAVEKFPKPPSTHGDATIFVNPPFYRPTPLIPKHRVTSSASSVEWKTWLSANVSKLESAAGRGNVGIIQYAVPTRSGHIREDAQITDEEEQPPLEVYRPTRPDSVLATIEHNTRTPPQTLRPIFKTASPIPHCEKENEAPECPEIQFQGVLRTTPSLASMGSAREAKIATEPRRKGFDSIRGKSLAHKSSFNTLAGNLTPTTRLVRKQPGSKTYVTPTPSPGPKAAADKQFRKLGGSSSSKRKFGLVASKTENVSPKADIDGDLDPYGVQGSGVLGPETDINPQSIGSKKIVDLFLSSRRRRMASSEDGGVFM
ncbi:hypothetical protein M434DRAFT_38787 [Hypoxylon sp. CO27-5]|nr:hypothetical protein M434DRAFT_38787 [Hypoxylon sp. CO27-5]